MNGTCIICGKIGSDNEIEEVDGCLGRVCAECRQNLNKGGREYAEQVVADKKYIKGDYENTGTNYGDYGKE